VDPGRFRIIRDSWQKTDRRDAVNLSLALWLSHISQQVRLPEVYQPQPTIRTLRQLFAQWQVLNKQIRQLKNQVHGLLTDNGITDRALGTRMVDRPAKGLETLGTLCLPSQELRACIQIDLELLGTLMEKKGRLKALILRTGQPLDLQVRLLIGIRGITPLLALAFLSDVGDIRRFRKLKGLHAYLGVVPTVRSSGGVTHVGHITRQSRGLTRTLLTQAVPHLVHSSRSLEKWYLELLHRKGRGRARIAVIRRVVGMMRHMLLFNEPYMWLEPRLYEDKLKEYQRELTKAA
jgi:transposase